MTELEEDNEEVKQLIPCSLCGRKFLAERLEKHTTVCNRIKEAQKKRKKFDSTKQRADLEAVNGYPISIPITPPNKQEIKTVNKTSNWREKHEEFLRTVRAARGEKVDDNTDGDIKPRVPVGYIECSACGRNFSDKAADRHIAWCKEQKARIPRSANNTNKAMERMKARTKYKPLNKSSPKTETPPTRPPTPPIKQMMAKTSRPSPPKTINIRKTPPNHVIKKKSSSSPTKSDQKRINSLSRPKNQSPDSLQPQMKNSAPVMKFKEKFPNHVTSDESNFVKKHQLIELMKKTETYNTGPRTVPGVRTGGMSPVKNESQIHSPNHHNGNYFDETEDEELAKLKTRIEEMYLNGSTKFKPNSITTNSPVINGSTNGKKSVETNSESTTRGSTSGSSDSSIQGMSRDGSSDGTRSNGSNTSGLPKFCHQCGTKYPITIAKYCYECGSRRLGTVGPFQTN